MVNGDGEADVAFVAFGSSVPAARAAAVRLRPRRRERDASWSRCALFRAAAAAPDRAAPSLPGASSSWSTITAVSFSLCLGDRAHCRPDAESFARAGTQPAAPQEIVDRVAPQEERMTAATAPILRRRCRRLPDRGQADLVSGLRPFRRAGGASRGLYAAMKAKPPKNVALVSGVGCSSRMPAYLTPYGFHGVHGRALAVCLGLEAGKRPDLNVAKVLGGDGDGYSIGGNHFLHACRRDIDLAYIVMDNRTYGMTRGQGFANHRSRLGRPEMAPEGTAPQPFDPWRSRWPPARILCALLFRAIPTAWRR